jgi:hypothetical protein
MEEQVLQFIRNPKSRDFASLALAVFNYQFRCNLPYRRFCLARGKTPEAVRDWREIPAVPTAAFKEMDLACGPAEKIFLTSGTTRGQEKRGRHLVPRLELYQRSALSHFAACFLPDQAKLRMLALIPSPHFLPTSSLAQMAQWVIEAYGTEGSGYFLDQQGMQLEGFCTELVRAEKEGTPVGILALTSALVAFFDLCEARGLHFSLPSGSRIMDTGGNKGQGRAISRRDFLPACWTYLRVAEHLCVNEYGMTEMSSQFYDGVLCQDFVCSRGPRYKIGPPWVRTLIIDPETLAEVPSGRPPLGRPPLGRPGLLRHFDLANCGSVMAIQTDDLGYAVGEGFEISGRAQGAETRGCSLMLEELLSAQ